MKVVKQAINMPVSVPIDALLDSIAQQGEEYIAAGNEHAAQVFLLRREGEGYKVEVIAIAPMPGTHAEKDAVAQAIGTLVQPFDAYIFLTEAYYLQVKSREEVARITGKVKEQPGRVEVFNLHFVTKAGESRMVDWEIVREEGKAPRFGRKNDRRNDMAEGRFVNFFLYAREPGERGN